MNKSLSYSLYFISLLFVVLYLVLSFHARLAGDDFFYLWLKNSFGAWNGMMYQYHHWSGRWTAHFIGCWLLNFEKSPLLLPFVCISSLILLFIGLKLNLKMLFEKFSIRVDKSILYPAIITLIAGLFFTSFNIGETWLWFIIVITYLWSIIGFLFVLHSIFNKNKKNIDYLVIITAAVFIGGASESFALIFLILLAAILFYRNRILKINFFESTNVKLLVSLIILGISFSFSVFAEGTAIRHSMLPHTPLTEKFLVVIKSYVKFFIRYLPAKLLLFLLFSTPWFFIGSLFKINVEKSLLLMVLKRVTVAFLITLFVMYIPTAIVMSETGPDRALSIISFLTTFYFATVFSISGNYFSLEILSFRKILIAFVVVAGIFLSYTIYDQYEMSRKFTIAYDERMQKIQDAIQNNFTGTLELKKMPEAGMLYWDELSTDTSHYTNQHLRDGLGLHFNVKLVEQK